MDLARLLLGHFWPSHHETPGGMPKDYQRRMSSRRPMVRSGKHCSDLEGWADFRKNCRNMLFFSVAYDLSQRVGSESMCRLVARITHSE